MIQLEESKEVESLGGVVGRCRRLIRSWYEEIKKVETLSGS